MSAASPINIEKIQKDQAIIKHIDCKDGIVASTYRMFNKKYKKESIPLGAGAFASVELVKPRASIVANLRLAAKTSEVKGKHQINEVKILHRLKDNQNIARCSNLCLPCDDNTYYDEENAKDGSTKKVFLTIIFDRYECNLLQLLRKNKVYHSGANPGAARYIMTAIVNAVHYLHSLDIMHRDLKPENILCKGPGKIAICDLGLSAYNANHIFKTKCGTPTYQAQEVYTQQNYSFESDCFAIGRVGGAITDIEKEEQLIEQIGNNLLDMAYFYDLMDSLQLKQCPETQHIFMVNIINNWVNKFSERWVDRLLLAMDKENTHMMHLIIGSLKKDPKSRPTIAKWKRTLHEIGRPKQDFYSFIELMAPSVETQNNNYNNNNRNRRNKRKLGAFLNNNHNNNNYNYMYKNPYPRAKKVKML